MAINSYFFNAVVSGGVYDRLYNAEDVTSYLDLLVGNGVFPNPSTQLQVRASSGMDVIVGAGSGWINGHKMISTADYTLTVEDSDVLLNRIDAVIFYVDFTTRSMGIEIKTGTVASTPSAPALEQDDDRYELCLAQISVPKQVTAITADMITDTRGNSALCGFVQGLIQQVDTTTLFQQWQSAFDTWFAAVQSQFKSGLAVRKFDGVYVTQNQNESSFNVKTIIPRFDFAYDILEVYINGMHLNSDEYTLSNNTVTLETPISEAGATVTFVIYQTVDPDVED
jgi:hypothetical protein